MKISCIVVDDEQRARSILKTYISDVSTLDYLGEFKNAIDALEFIQNNRVDLIFLDIEMPKLSGLSFAKLIEHKSQVIFTTAHREFALEGFELDALDYLLKPFSFDRFLKAVQKISAKHNANNNKQNIDYMFVKVNKQMQKINYDNLLYIEGLSNYVKFHTTEKPLVVYDKLSNLNEVLPADQFLRVHKSYIINTSKIKLYTKEFVEIENKHIPISATYRSTLMSFLSNN